MIAKSETNINQRIFSIFGGKISHRKKVLAKAKIAPIVIIVRRITAKDAVTRSICRRSINTNYTPIVNYCAVTGPG